MTRTMAARTLVPVLLGVLSLVGCSSADTSHHAGPGTATSRPFPPPTIAWTPCPSVGQGLECGAIKVPVDHSRPEGGTVEVRVSRLAATDTEHRIGVLLVSPGGPGISGITFPLTLRRLAAVHAGDAKALARFDLIGFDPRGVGARPVSCGNFTPLRSVNPAPADASGRTAVQDAAKALADQCVKVSAPGQRLASITTIDSVRDLDLVRRALGEKQLTLFGLSYGTRVFGTYAGLFPERVRALVLDGPMPASASGLDLARGQMDALDWQFAALLTACAKQTTCPFGDGDPLGTFDRLLARWVKAPMPVPGGEPLTATQASRGYTAALFNTYQRPALLQALADASTGDVASTAKLWEAAQSPDASPAAALVTLCNDYTWPEADRLYATLVTDRPPDARLSRAAAVSYLPCGYWSASARPSSGQPVGWPTAAKGVPPILVLGGTGDPSTPYDWAVQLTAHLDRATLVTRDGDGHVSFSRSQCISDVTSAYLTDLRLPPAGTRCPTEL